VDRLLEATYRAEQTHFWFRGLIRFSRPLILEALKGIARPEILDCGCGTGANMKRLTEFGRVAGFDISWQGLEFARSYDQRRLVQASVLDMPFTSQAFDLVTAFDMLACLDDEKEAVALAEMYRVLRPGGALLVNTAALRFLRGQHAVFGSEVRRLTRGHLRASLERAGFEIVRLTYTNFTLLPFMIPVRLTQRFIGLSTPEETGADIAVPAAAINGTLSGLVAIESALLKFINMPLGSSLLALARKKEDQVKS
jgi:SAM-dependent methyltransferase